MKLMQYSIDAYVIYLMECALRQKQWVEKSESTITHKIFETKSNFHVK